MKAWKHFCTITKHRFLVMEGCFRVGLYWRGLCHDLSKYGPTEFLAGAKYYQGNRSPNTREREVNGYSVAWMHHKGRNKHHYEYWTDVNMKSRQYETFPMPRKYLVEMVMDRRAACITYQKEKYTDASSLIYFEGSIEQQRMHPQTARELHYLLTMLKEKGEKETFRYMRRSVLHNKPFPWES